MTWRRCVAFHQLSATNFLADTYLLALGGLNLLTVIVSETGMKRRPPVWLRRPCVAWVKRSTFA